MAVSNEYTSRILGRDVSVRHPFWTLTETLGTSYYKLTGIAIHYKDVSLRWKNKKFGQKLTPTSFQAGFWRNCELRLGTLSWTVSHIVILYQGYLLAIHSFQAHLQQDKGLQRDKITF